MTAFSSKAFGRAVPILIGVLLLVRLAAMTVVPLMDTTEARYGEIGRKMAELSDWVTPWFDYGVPYWGKPPLAFWLTAISFDIFGVNEFAARLPHLIVSLAIIGLVAWMARRRNPEAAWPAVVCISAAPVFFISAGAVLTDIELTFASTLAMTGFWIALERGPMTGSDRRSGLQSRSLASLLFFGGLVVGMLAKGPVAWVLAGVPIVLWTAYTSRWRDVWCSLPWIRGVVLTLVISLPWYLIAEGRTPGFLHYFLVGEHFHRFFTPGWHGDLYGNTHPSAFGAIWVFATIDLLPWSVLLPIAAWRWRTPGATLTAMFTSTAKAVTGGLSRRPVEVGYDKMRWQSYLLLWAFTPLLLFTPARNVGWTYVLPGIPAAAILAGQWLTAQARKGRNINSILCVGPLLMLGLIFAAAIPWLQPATMERKSTKGLLAAYARPLSEQATASAAGLPDLKPAKTTLPLIFVRRRPFSAEFYTRGQAILVADANEAWSRIGAGAAYVATSNSDVFLAAAGDSRADKIGDEGGHMGSNQLARRTVHRIGRYGKFDLLFVDAL